MRAWWILATGFARFLKLNRTIIPVLLRRFRGRLLGSAEFCAIFLRWGLGRLRCWIHCDSAQSLAVKMPEAPRLRKLRVIAGSWTAWCAGSDFTAIVLGCPLLAAKWCSSPAIRIIRW